MTGFSIRRQPGDGWTLAKRIALGLAGVAIGGAFLWLALRDINRRDLEITISQVSYSWLVAGVALYLGSMVARCIRWGILLRATGSVKWRHVVETLLAGFAANYLLPGRIGELFRAEYARRLFALSRFTSLGTIVTERVCDGVILVCALWLGLALTVSRLDATSSTASWMLAVGAVSSVVFGLALLFVIMSRRIAIRRFGVPEFIASRWMRLIDGVSSVARGNMFAVIFWSLMVWVLEILALSAIIAAFTVPFSIPQMMVLVAIGSLSTLLPTAPGYLGTYQFAFAQVFAQFGHPPSVGIVVSSAMQVFCFGIVAILGILVLLSRGGITMLRALSGERQDGAGV